MIDIKLIRDNPKHVAAKIKDRGFDADLDKILKLDGQVKELNISVQKLREERNKISKEKDLGEKEKKLEATNKDLQELLLQIPFFNVFFFRNFISFFPQFLNRYIQ